MRTIFEYFFNLLNYIVHFCQRQQNKKYSLSGMPKLFDAYWKPPQPEYQEIACLTLFLFDCLML